MSNRISRRQINQINRQFLLKPKLLVQEEIHLIAAIKKEKSISNCVITDQNKTFAIYTPRYWQDNDTKKN